MKRLLSLLILCALPSWGAIGYVSSASAAAASVSITTPSSGNIIVVCAYRESNTAATTATGYRVLTSSGTNTNSLKVAYKVSDGTETTSGTWTNAGYVAAAVYSGADRLAPLGAYDKKTLTTGSSGTTLTYGSLTASMTDSSSWIIGCGGHRTSTSAAPSGMTNRTSATKLAMHDTNGAVASFSSATASGGTTAAWRTQVFELRAAQLSGPSSNLLVQHHATAPTEQSITTPFTIKCQFPNPTRANNLLILAMTHTTGVSVSSVVDDTSTTWTTGPAVTNGNGVADSRIFYRANAPANILQVTVTFSGTTSEMFYDLSEFYGVATSSPVDGTATGATVTSASALQSGSITTTQNGSLVYQYAADVQTTFYTNNTDSEACSPDAGYELLHCDKNSSNAAQYGLKATAGAVNPSLTIFQAGNPDSWNTLSIAFKVDGSGTAPSGMRIVREFTASPFANAVEPIQFPTRGNLIVVAASNSSLQVSFTAVADTKSNSYTEVQLDSTTPQIWYAQNSTPSLDMTVTVTANAAGNVVRLYDIAGAHATAYDTSAWGNGDKNAGTVELTETVDITPGVTSGLTIMVLAFGDGPVRSCTGPSGAITTTSLYSGETDGGNMNYGDSWCHKFFTSNATQTWSWQHNTSATVTSWIAEGVTFRAADTGGGTVSRRRFVVQ